MQEEYARHVEDRCGITLGDNDYPYDVVDADVVVEQYELSTTAGDRCGIDLGTGRTLQYE